MEPRVAGALDARFGVDSRGSAEAVKKAAVGIRGGRRTTGVAVRGDDGRFGDRLVGNLYYLRKES